MARVKRAFGSLSSDGKGRATTRNPVFDLNACNRPRWCLDQGPEERASEREEKTPTGKQNDWAPQFLALGLGRFSRKRLGYPPNARILFEFSMRLVKEEDNSTACADTKVPNFRQGKPKIPLSRIRHFPLKRWSAAVGTARRRANKL